MKAEVMRENAENCLALAEENKANQPTQLRYIRMASAWQALADNQDWLDAPWRITRPIIPGSVTPPNQ